jgi:hypothetical protein
MSQPGCTATTSARTLGTLRPPARTCTSALTSLFAALSSPRGRWYLNERPSTLTPLAASAELIVSPAKPWQRRPSKLKSTVRVRSMSSPASCGTRLMCARPV